MIQAYVSPDSLTVSLSHQAMLPPGAEAKSFFSWGFELKLYSFPFWVFFHKLPCRLWGGSLEASCQKLVLSRFFMTSDSQHTDGHTYMHGPQGPFQLLHPGILVCIICGYLLMGKPKPGIFTTFKEVSDCAQDSQDFSENFFSVTPSGNGMQLERGEKSRNEEHLQAWAIYYCTVGELHWKPGSRFMRLPLTKML